MTSYSQSSAVDVTVAAPPVSAVAQRVSMSARDLSLGFGSATILSGLNIDIPKGCITALIGPTGSGKTTFLRSLNRMNDRVSKHWHKGDVLLGGQSIYAPGVQLMQLRRRVGMMFQRPNPFPMSVQDNILAGVKAHRIARREYYKEIVKTRLQEVGLWDAVSHRLGSSPFALSGGQQQLLCLARALAIGPEVLLLDEPTSSLDPITTENVEAMIRTLVPALTIVIVTHNLGQARRLSDKTIFFYQGRMVEFADTAQLFEDPKEPETARYVSGRIG
ncbi:MAG TPA: ATP-binding cassette domain-containing protein [Acidimicrobiales bacterium]|nr:ATP-binding cassette domain-containing protein [Acidimicrobiales bacterium]